MKSHTVIVVAVLNIVSASPLTRGGCTPRDALCWQDDGFDGFVYIANPKYGGDGDSTLPLVDRLLLCLRKPHTCPQDDINNEYKGEY